MSLTQYACEMMAYGPGMVLAAGRFKFESTGPTFDLTVDSVPSTAKTVIARTGAGTFDVTLPKVGGGWPQEMIACLPTISYNDATDAGVDEVNEIRYVTDSYVPSTGTFTLINVIVTGSVSTAVGDPNDEAEIHFIAMLRKDKILGQTV